MFGLYRGAMWAVTLAALCLLRKRAGSGEGAVIPPLFRSYLSAEIAFSAASGIFMIPTLSGSFTHFKYFAAAGLLVGIFRMAAIMALGWSLPVRPSKPALAAGLVLGLLPLAMVPWKTIVSWQAFLWIVQSGAVLAVLIGINRNRDLRIGRNLAGILLWFAINVLSQYILWVAGLAGAQYSILRWLIQIPAVVSSLAASALLARRDEPVLVLARRKECRSSL